MQQAQMDVGQHFPAHVVQNCSPIKYSTKGGERER